MAIEYIAPVERAWGRTRAMLFEPFHVERWLVLGWAAFLAGLTENGFGLVPSTRPSFWLGRLDRVGRWHHWPEILRDSLFGWHGLGVTTLLGLVLLGVFLYVSSRAKFVFLENVVHDRAEFVDPWRRSAAPGESLFRWRLVFVLLTLLATGLAVGPAWWTGAFHRGHDAWLALPFVLLAIVVGSVLALAFIVINLLLNDFVVPVMAAYDLSAREAWRLYLSLARRQPVEFLLYVVLVAFLAIGLLVALTVISVVCCFLPFVLALPYLGSVLLLPLSAGYRRLSLEFLAQFGGEWDFRHPPSAG